MENTPETYRLPLRVSLTRPIMMGGTAEGQARANEDFWQKLLAFLDKYLRNQP